MKEIIGLLFSTLVGIWFATVTANALLPWPISLLAGALIGVGCMGAVIWIAEWIQSE